MIRYAFTLVTIMLIASCSNNTEPQKIPDYPSANELAAMLASGATTSTAIVSELLDRAAQADGLNAYIVLDREGALARAKELDRMRADGSLLGPLHGVPLVVKDNIHVAGMPNTAGTPGLSGFVPREDSPAVAQLRDAGAIILGKANMHELAFGITSDNTAYGAVANPFDTTTFAGGSSGGTAAAVSAGLAPAGLGSDTGGSARIPAALTGVVGYRPSTDRYDSSAVTPISVTRDTVGVIARTVADVQLIDTVLSAGADDKPPIELRQIRLGVANAYYYDNLDEASAAVIDAALARLVTEGVTLVESDPGDIGALIARSGFALALFETARDLPTYLQTYNAGVTLGELAGATASPDVNGLFTMLAGGNPVTDEAYADAHAARAELRQLFRTYFEENELDAMVFATTLLPSRPIAGSLETVELNGERVPTFPTYIHNTDPASIAALPGISLPVGLTDDGLPVGLELDGPEGSDRRLLAIAAALEPIFDFSARPPAAE